MSPEIVGIIGIFTLFLFLALRMQIGFAMALVGFLGFAYLNSFDSALFLVGMVPFKTGGHYLLSVIPLFLLMGQFAYQSKLGTDIYQMAYKWVGFLPGGLAMATVGACSSFAAISGSSLATAATFGMVALPEMKKFNYSDALATGCIAAGGTLGILIPPSTVLILYGLLTETGIGELFIAAFMPGILLSFLFIFSIYIITKIRPEMGLPGPKFTMSEKVKSLKNTWSILLLFFIVIGGLYTGWFTPTEAAGIGAFGAFVITLIKGRMTRETLKDSFREAAKTTAMVFGILLGAGIFQYFMTISGLPDHLATWVVGLGLSPMAVMALIIMMFIVLGCFMEGLSILILAVPIIFPIVLQLGFNPVWFGIIITITMEMSLITPPVGVNVFVLSGVAKDIPMSTIFKGVFPFWLSMLICIILLMIFPEIVLFLPGTMM